MIPVLQTSRVSCKHTSLEEIRGITHFVDKLDKIELPNQIVSTLGDSMAQKYLHLTQSETANHRLNEWLRSFLEDKLEQIRQDADDAVPYSGGRRSVRAGSEVPGLFLGLQQGTSDQLGRPQRLHRTPATTGQPLVVAAPRVSDGRVQPV